MSALKICFLGTPEFAAVHLRSLLANPNFQVVGVVTQPDRPAGRKLILTPSPVKILALENNIQVLTPNNLKKEPEVFNQIKSWGAEAAVVVAFGQILSQEFLNSFKFGAVNVHGSLLPLWRGAAPIQRSIQAGDKLTGVCLQKMVQKLDAGPIIGKREFSIDSEINATGLYEKLSVLGAQLLENEFLDYINGKIKLTEQNEAEVTIASKINKEEALLTWSESAISTHNKVRAFSMGPGTFVNFKGKRLKIHKTKVIDETSNGEIGKIIQINSEGLFIQCGVGIVALLEVQPESKSKMHITDFLKSCDLKKGDLLV